MQLTFYVGLREMPLRSKLKSAAFAAVDAGELDALAALVRDDSTLLTSRDHRHDSLLHRAAEAGNVDVMAFLVSRGICIDVRRVFLDGTEFLHMPLHAAARANQRLAVDWLIENGATLNAGSDVSATPLAAAALGGHADMVEHLLRLGADPTASYEVEKEDGGKETIDALYLARLRGHRNVVAILEATIQR